MTDTNIDVVALGQEIKDRYLLIKSTLEKDAEDITALQYIEGIDRDLHHDGSAGIFTLVELLEAAGGDLEKFTDLSLKQIKEMIKPLYASIVQDMIDLAQSKEAENWQSSILLGLSWPLEDGVIHPATTQVPSLESIVKIFGSGENLGFETGKLHDTVHLAWIEELEQQMTDFADALDAGKAEPDMLMGSDRYSGILRLAQKIKEFGAWDKVPEENKEILNDEESLKDLLEEAEFQRDALYIIRNLENYELNMFDGEKLGFSWFVGENYKGDEMRDHALLPRIDKLQYAGLSGYDALQDYCDKYKPITHDENLSKVVKIIETLNEDPLKWLEENTDPEFHGYAKKVVETFTAPPFYADPIKLDPMEWMRNKSRPEYFREDRAAARLMAIKVRELPIRERVAICWDYAEPQPGKTYLEYEGPSLPETKPKGPAADIEANGPGSAGGGSSNDGKPPARAPVRRMGNGLIGGDLTGSDEVRPPLAPRSHQPGRRGNNLTFDGG